MPFVRILRALVWETPRARGAIFCDHEGESIAHALASPSVRLGMPPLSEDDLKICGAQLAGIVHALEERSREHGAGSLQVLELRTRSGTVLCSNLPDGYCAALVLAHGTHTTLAVRALERTRELLLRQM